MNKNKIMTQSSKQLCHKSWAKSILFSGLIGFNFLITYNAEASLSDETADRYLIEDFTPQDIINEFVKKHPGFELSDIRDAISNINSISDNLLERTNALLEILNTCVPEMNQAGIRNEELSVFISLNTMGITVDELKDKLERKKIAYKLVKNHPSFNLYRISNTLSHIQGTPDDNLFDYINNWATEVKAFKIHPDKSSSFIYSQPDGITINELKVNLERKKIAYKFAAAHPEFKDSTIYYALSHIEKATDDEILGFLEEWTQKFLEATGSNYTFPCFINYFARKKNTYDFFRFRDKVNVAEKTLKELKNITPSFIAMILSYKDFYPQELLAFINQLERKVQELEFYKDNLFCFIDSIIINNPDIDIDKLEKILVAILKIETTNLLHNITSNDEFKTNEINLAYELLSSSRMRAPGVIYHIGKLISLYSLLDMTMRSIVGTNGDPEYEETDAYKDNEEKFKSLTYKEQLRLKLEYSLKTDSFKDATDAQIKKIWEMFEILDYDSQKRKIDNQKKNIKNAAAEQKDEI